jgi:hypothetical protein
MGVACDEVEEPFEAGRERVDAVPMPKAPARQGQGAYVLLNSQVNASYSVAFALLKDKAEMWRTTAHAAAKGVELPAGSFIVKNTPEVKKALPAILDKYHLTVLDVDDVAALPKAALKAPRIGLFQSWRGNMDEGWTRFVFDDLGVPYKTLHNADIKGTKEKKADLRAEYDVIVFADENANTIKEPGRRDPGAAPSRPWPDLPAGTIRPSTRADRPREVDASKLVEKGGPGRVNGASGSPSAISPPAKFPK